MFELHWTTKSCNFVQGDKYSRIGFNQFSLPPTGCNCSVACKLRVTQLIKWRGSSTSTEHLKGAETSKLWKHHVLRFLGAADTHLGSSIFRGLFVPFPHTSWAGPLSEYYLHFWHLFCSQAHVSVGIEDDLEDVLEEVKMEALGLFTSYQDITHHSHKMVGSPLSIPFYWLKHPFLWLKMVVNS